ncbi:MAG: hypothetical protein HY020_25785, partial [Burkholderiales bacterium]|nr:hypothetical protein [Burkholderiales bacterium]
MYGFVYLVFLLALPWGTPFLPVLGLAKLVLLRDEQRGRIDWPTIAGLTPLILLLGLGASAKGIAQLLLCISSLLIYKRLARSESFEARLSQIPVLLSALTLLLAPWASYMQTVPDSLALLYVPGDHGGVRFRMLFPEPNHFAFFYFFLLLSQWHQIQRRGTRTAILCLTGALAAAIGTGSPMAYLGALCVTLLIVYAQPIAIRIPVLCITGLLAFAVALSLPANIASRIELLLEGEDNSLNLRTLGALAIAEATNIESGSSWHGVGIGQGREALEDNPFMAVFAAGEESVLPSMAGTVLLESGYIGLFSISGLL